MIARQLQELGLFNLSEGVWRFQDTKYFFKKENIGVIWRKTNKKQELELKSGKFK